jgi:hypothetical protein
LGITGLQTGLCCCLRTRVRYLVYTTFSSPTDIETPEKRKIEELDLSIVVTIVGGKDCLRNTLSALVAQVDSGRAVEIIVPYDRWSLQATELSSEFRSVNFHKIAETLDEAPDFEHRLFDRRRAAGLRISRGLIVAMTEDHAIPAADWVERLLEAHTQHFLVIGGAVMDGSINTLNSAIYYCDFGRYGLPFESSRAGYVSDVNVAYKREALEKTRDLWWTDYHETTVHWALQGQGFDLFLDNRPVVTQKRPPIGLVDAFSERTEWGRVFAETRTTTVSGGRRVLLALGSVLLPPIMFARVFMHMRRQRLPISRILRIVPYALVLLVGWALGELRGYTAYRAVPALIPISPTSTSRNERGVEAAVE